MKREKAFIEKQKIKAIEEEQVTIETIIKELNIIKQQPIFGIKGSFIGCMLKNIIDSTYQFNPKTNVEYLMSYAYSYGVMQGKRIERSKK